MKLACVVAALMSCTMALALDYQPIQVSEDFLLQQPEYCTFRYY